MSTPHTSTSASSASGWATPASSALSASSGPGLPEALPLALPQWGREPTSSENTGMPGDRLARMAARRAFVEMKLCFMRAAAEVPGPTGLWLQRELRLVSEITELWRLRIALFDALPLDTERNRQHRAELQYHLDSAFSEVDDGPMFF
jgi:hypothetical protein